MKNDTLILLAALGVGGYLLYKVLNKASDIATGASTAIADAWLKMFPLPPSIELLGNIRFPGNLLVSLQSLSQQGAVKNDPSTGKVFVKYADVFWTLSPHDATGNWPATRVS